MERDINSPVTPDIAKYEFGEDPDQFDPADIAINEWQGPLSGEEVEDILRKMSPRFRNSSFPEVGNRRKPGEYQGIDAALAAEEVEHINLEPGLRPGFVERAANPLSNAMWEHQQELMKGIE